MFWNINIFTITLVASAVTPLVQAAPQASPFDIFGPGPVFEPDPLIPAVIASIPADPAESLGAIVITSGQPPRGK